MVSAARCLYISGPPYDYKLLITPHVGVDVVLFSASANNNLQALVTVKKINIVIYLHIDII